MTACIYASLDREQIQISETYLGFQFVALELLKQVCLHFDLFGLFVPLHAHKLGLLVAQLEQVLAELHAGPQLAPNAVLELLELEHMFLLHSKKDSSSNQASHVHSLA